MPSGLVRQLIPIPLVALVGCAASPTAWSVSLGELDGSARTVALDAEREVTLELRDQRDFGDEPALSHRARFVDADARGERAVGVAASTVDAQTSVSAKQGRSPLRRASRTGAPSSVTRVELVPLLPLPSMRVEIANAGSEPLRLDELRVTALLSDHAFPSLPREVAIDRALRRALERFPQLSRVENRDSLDALRAALATVPYAGAPIVVPPRTRWEGFVSFAWEAQAASDGQELTRAEALRIEVAYRDQRRVVSFPIDRQRRWVRCRDGSTRLAGDCRPAYTQVEPEPAGPCIQETRIDGRIFLRQSWLGLQPVANSDIDDALLRDPATHALARRAVALRWVGALLIAGGIGGAVAASVAISRAVDQDTAPAGLALLGISFAGLGVALGSTRVHTRAVELYNRRAAATGGCGGW